MARRSAPPPPSEAPATTTGSFQADRADTVRLTVDELRRQLEAHGLKGITEQDVAVAPPEDADARRRRLIDD